ncbi:beta strand repeat-containing protein, partial [Bacteroidota bacterium]
MKRPVDLHSATTQQDKKLNSTAGALKKYGMGIKVRLFLVGVMVMWGIGVMGQTVDLSVTESALTETNGVTPTTTITATISPTSTLTTTVNLGFSGTATHTEDYTVSSTTIVIPANISTSSTTLTTVDDALFEGGTPEDVVIGITGLSTNATVGTQSSVTVTIEDNDSEPEVSLSATPLALTETSGATSTSTITATLTHVNTTTSVTVTLGYSGSATVTDDYTYSGTQIVIPAGDLSATATVTTVDDDLYEGSTPENIVIDINSVSSGTISSTADQVTLTIAENDSEPEVSLSATPLALTETSGATSTSTITATLTHVNTTTSVTVTLGYSGSATVTDDYTYSGTQIVIPAGDLSATATVTTVDDDLYEGSTPENIVIDINSVSSGTISSTADQVTLTIQDNNAAPLVTMTVAPLLLTETNTGTATTISTITVELDAVSGLPVTVDLGYSGTATSTSDYDAPDQIIIAAGTQSNTGTLTATNDGQNEVNETVIIDITGVTNGIESGTQSATITIDGTTQTPNLILPASSTADGPTVDLSFTVPEDAQDGSANMTFTRVGGVNDNQSPHVITFVTSPGTYSYSAALDGTNLSSYTSTISSVTSKGNPGTDFVDGAIYDVVLQYKDYLGNAAATVTNTSFYYEQVPFDVEDIIDVAPDPRSSTVTSVTVDFNKLVDVSLVNDSHFRLTLDGVDVSLSSTGLISYSTDEAGGYYDDPPPKGSGPVYSSRYFIDLSSYTSDDGSYVFTLFRTGTTTITSQSGAGLPSATYKESWVKDATPPTLSTVSIESNNTENPGFIGVGGTVSVSLTASEGLQDSPTIIFNKTGTVSSTVTASKVNGLDDYWSGTYTITSGDDEGPISVDIEMADLAGNAGTHSGTTDASSVTIDKTTATLTSVTMTSSNTTDALAKVEDVVTLQFTGDEALKSKPGVIIAGHEIAPGSITNSTGNTWKAIYTMAPGDAEGSIPYTIDFEDLAGNKNTVSSTTSYVTFDKTGPTVSAITITASNPTNASSIPVTITFNEQVTGFDQSDLTLVNCAVSALTPTGNITFTGTLSPTTSDGTLSVDVGAGVATDLAGNN